jgi:hypothetical protein
MFLVFAALHCKPEDIPFDRMDEGSDSCSVHLWTEKPVTKVNKIPLLDQYHIAMGARIVIPVDAYDGGRASGLSACGTHYGEQSISSVAHLTAAPGTLVRRSARPYQHVETDPHPPLR